ncbi:MAG: ATP-binding protein [Actinobacteria bacterium]|nr:ATP-binding protein [Actinomycetota bacterium]
MAENVEITLSSRPEFVGAVRHVFHALGVLSELPPGALEDLKLAVSEAVTNAIGRQGETAGEVRITASREGDGVSVEVADSGPAMNPSLLEDPDPAEPSSQEFSFESGLSLPLIRGLVEDLDFDAPGEGGLTVRFSVRGEPEPG